MFYIHKMYITYISMVTTSKADSFTKTLLLFFSRGMQLEGGAINYLVYYKPSHIN